MGNLLRDLSENSVIGTIQIPLNGGNKVKLSDILAGADAKMQRLEEQLLAEQAKNKKLVEALEEIRWYKTIGKDVHKIQQIAAHAVAGIDVLENGLRGLEVNNAK